MLMVFGFVVCCVRRLFGNVVGDFATELLVVPHLFGLILLTYVTVRRTSPFSTRATIDMFCVDDHDGRAHTIVRRQCY